MVQFSPKHEQNKVEDIADNLKVKLTILILQVSRDMVMGAKASVSQAQQGDILQAERSQVSMSSLLEWQVTTAAGLRDKEKLRNLDDQVVKTEPLIKDEVIHGKTLDLNIDNVIKETELVEEGDQKEGGLKKEIYKLERDKQGLGERSSKKGVNYKSKVLYFAAAASITLSDSEEDRVGPEVVEGDEENNVDVNDESSEETGSMKRKYQSPVWEFSKKVDGKAVCNIFQATFVCPNGNSSNITGHILGKQRKTQNAVKLKESLDERSKAKAAKKDIEDKRAKEDGRQLCINSFFPGSTQLPKKVKDEIDNNLIEFIICDNSSFETVESHFLRKMMFSANKSYILPSRSTITRQIDDKIICVKKNLAKEIQNDIAVHKTISITSDGGNSGDLSETKKNTVTISRVTEDFKLKTR